MQLNVFLSRLCGEPIGFTVLGIFVIDKNTVLTVGDHQHIVCRFVVNLQTVYTVRLKSKPKLLSQQLTEIDMGSLGRVNPWVTCLSWVRFFCVKTYRKKRVVIKKAYNWYTATGQGIIMGISRISLCSL